MGYLTLYKTTDHKMKSDNSNRQRQDIRLLRDRFVEGDDGAFAEIYRIYARELYAFGIFLRAKTEIIEDALHDVFVELYQRREKLAGIQNLKVYLMVAFKNRLFYLRKKEQISIEITDRQAYFYSDSNYMETLMEYEDSLLETNRTVKKVMSELNAHQQEVLYHRFIEGLTIDEIALLMNINYQSVKNLLHRSIKKIRGGMPGRGTPS